MRVRRSLNLCSQKLRQSWRAELLSVEKELARQGALPTEVEDGAGPSTSDGFLSSSMCEDDRYSAWVAMLLG